MHVTDPRQVPSGVYLYTLRPTRLAMLTDGATADEQAAAARHWAYSQELLTRGVVVFAGRMLTRDAESVAIVVIRASSAENARAIVDGDPAVANGVFQAQLFPFQPMLMGGWPPESADVMAESGATGA